jgi:hypothetical protein
MKTEQILLNKFGDRYVPLEKVAPEYFGINDRRTILRMANRREFNGLVPFKAGIGERAPWLVDLVNLADVLDRRAIEARK